MTWPVLRGERYSVRPYGDGEDARVVAADLSPTMRMILKHAPDGDFARYGYLAKTKILDSALRRGFIERCGYHRDGQWQYRLTLYGTAVRNVVLAQDAA
jgi:hypothetical protein